MMRYTRVFTICSILLLSTGIARAERKFVIGNQYDFAFGVANSGVQGAAQLQSSLSPFYSFYPSIDVGSVGRNTDFRLSYTALADWFRGNPSLTSLSHVVDGDIAGRVGRRFHYEFRGSFSSAPDYTSVNVLRGTAPSPDNFQFAFQPSIGKTTTHRSSVGVNAQIDLSYRSYVVADFSAMSFHFLQNNVASGLFVDQTREEAKLGYWYHTSAHQSIGLQYDFIENNYSGNGSGRMQAGVLGYMRQINPALQVEIGAGPAYVTFDQISPFYSYVAIGSVTRKIRSSQLSFYYRHTPGDSLGLGTLSDIHAGGLSLFAPLWGKLQIGSSMSGFVGKQLGNSSNDYQGFYGSVDLSYPLSRRWFLTWGGSYIVNFYSTPANQEFKRLYISIRFRAPGFWRTSL